MYLAVKYTEVSLTRTPTMAKIYTALTTSWQRPVAHVAIFLYEPPWTIFRRVYYRLGCHAPYQQPISATHLVGKEESRHAIPDDCTVWRGIPHPLEQEDQPIHWPAIESTATILNTCAMKSVQVICTAMQWHIDYVYERTARFR